MIKVLEQAIEKIRGLPEDRQAYAAEVLEQIAAAGTESSTSATAHAPLRGGMNSDPTAPG
jgi:hypothetical protein